MRDEMSLSDRIIAYENGELHGDFDGTLELFQQLVDTGLAWTLQGHYGRSAMSLLKQGLIFPGSE